MATDRAREPRPILLTKVEALTYAAERLERMAIDMELAEIIVTAMDKPFEKPLDDKSAELLTELRQTTKEPKIQAVAMREAAKAIRELALEERIISARVLTNGIHA